MVHRNHEDDVDAEEISALRFDRRRQSNIKDWAVIITLFFNLAGLVWTAAKWSSAIEQLQLTSQRTNETMAIYGQSIQNLITEQALLKLQMQLNTSRVNDVEKDK